MIRRKTKGESGGNITYHSRMRYLKSRDGASLKMTTLGDRASEIMKKKSGSKAPCSSETLIPPQELMTRQRSFRHLYWKYHPPTTNIRKMSFLQRKEDPISIKRREEIFEKIHAAELAVERQKKGNDAWKRSEKRRGSVIEVELKKSITDNSHDRDDKMNDSRESLGKQRTGGNNNSNEVSDFIFDKKKNSKLFSVISDTDGAYPQNFSFLSDWKEEK